MRSLRLSLLAGVCAGAIALAWLGGAQQRELAEARAAAAASTSIIVTIEDEPAHLGCSRIENHSSRALRLEVRSNPTAAPSHVAVAPGHSTDVCVDYRTAGG